MIRRRDTGPWPESGRIEIAISGTAGIGAASSRPEPAPPVAGLVRVRAGGSATVRPVFSRNGRLRLRPECRQRNTSVSPLAVGNVDAVASVKVSTHRMADVSTSWPICQSPATDEVDSSGTVRHSRRYESCGQPDINQIGFNNPMKYSRNGIISFIDWSLRMR